MKHYPLTDVVRFYDRGGERNVDPDGRLTPLISTDDEMNELEAVSQIDAEVCGNISRQVEALKTGK